MKIIEKLENREEALTVKEVARILGDSPGDVYRKVSKGLIEGSFRNGRSIRFIPSVFVEWLKKKLAENCKREASTTNNAKKEPSSNAQQQLRPKATFREQELSPLARRLLSVKPDTKPGEAR